MNGLISLEVWKFTELYVTDKFGSLEVYKLYGLISLEVWKFTELCVMMISLEVWKFTYCV